MNKRELLQENMPEIRQALASDEADVCTLWRVLLQFYSKEATDELLRHTFRYAVEHPEQILIYLAYIGGRAVGTVSMHLGHYSTWNDYWYGHVEDLIVVPEFRRRGVARRLLKQIEEAARQLELGRVELLVLNDNLPARILYEQFGFTTDSAVYELPICGASNIRKERKDA